MDERIDRTNYEQEHPRHPTEDEYWDRARQRLDQALRHVDELEARIAKNAGHTSPEKTVE
jgi:hypothetical protein